MPYKALYSEGPKFRAFLKKLEKPRNIGPSEHRTFRCHKRSYVPKCNQRQKIEMVLLLCTRLLGLFIFLHSEVSMIVRWALPGWSIWPSHSNNFVTQMKSKSEKSRLQIIKLLDDKKAVKTTEGGRCPKHNDLIRWWWLLCKLDFVKLGPKGRVKKKLVENSTKGGGHTGLWNIGIWTITP